MHIKIQGCSFKHERGDTAKFGTRLYVQRIHEKLGKKLDEIGRSRLNLNCTSVILFPSGKWPATNKNPFIATINHSEFLRKSIADRLSMGIYARISAFSYLELLLLKVIKKGEVG